ncbi:pyrroline-5-carboxylate reductase [Sodalis-like endosymbiont of Proechinophthirus fluctus]|uniref:pyrroline-5-carboxylate reductase n=1 Tax=Sodalis-like endosymbiont of Proechinophthirus fluctus TaxID=1462730 RepID=UPI0007A899DA|nr:pyrroline-5-carboxylate reductase [Sodalis-like endosymbiont of Proechinophthirus fluctus]KYP97121.1 pyrroline-5-carboxylate reductase [Sodalis-like endosymbiont of Proechinophthirus fluctus]
MQHCNITFIGAGNMVQAIIAGLVNNGYPAHLITVCAPSATHRGALAERYGVQSSGDNLRGARNADVVVLAVKPQLIAQVCESLRVEVDFSGKLVLSIAAGVTLSRFYELLGENIAIVRMMPNTPCLVGKGMCGLYAPPQTSEEDRAFSAQLMGTVGKLCWLKQESDINGIIATASSAPAYFFLFMEAMQQQALTLGFDETTARTLVLQAAAGAAALAADAGDTSFAILRQNVTSKGGTTAAALQVFEQQELSRTVASAMQAAVARAEEMEKLF